jgi:hypothetical protein
MAFGLLTALLIRVWPNRIEAAQCGFKNTERKIL